MKRFKIDHNTRYDFSEPVALLPHTLRLRPREGHELRIEASTLNITPPATLRWHRDVEGNSVAIASFSANVTQLSVQSDITIQKYDHTPHDFLVSDYAVDYPFDYEDHDKAILLPYINTYSDREKAALEHWLGKVFNRKAPIQSFALLQQLNQSIYLNFAYTMREEAGVQSAEQTLLSASGSCRDFAHLFVVAARHLGFAARFVSGYIYDNSPSSLSGSTHAWAEVFIPGAGWKGFDSTFGQMVGADHITVAVARLSESVPPIAGSFLGNASAVMTVDVWVSDVSP